MIIMSNFFDFIRKRNTNANQSDSASSNDTTKSDIKVIKEESTGPQVSGMGQSYNGIGPTPSGGTPYNGIGPTPQGGEPYSGIGTTPSGQTPYSGIGSTPSGGTPYNGIGEAPGSASGPNQAGMSQSQPPTDKMSTLQGDKIVPVAPIDPKAEKEAMEAIKDLEQSNKNLETPSKDVESEKADMKSNMSDEKDDKKHDDKIKDEKFDDENKMEKMSDEKSGEIPKSGDVLKSKLDEKKRNELDVMTHFTQRSNKVFVEATNKARALHNTYVDSEHVLYGLLKDGEIYNMFVEMKVQPQLIEQELDKSYKKENVKVEPQIAPRVKRIVDNSLLIARKMGFEFISPEHILLALYDEGEGLGARILVKLAVKKEDLNKKVTGKKEGLFEDKEKKQQRQRSALEQYCIDLTQKAADGQLDPVVERSDVIERVVHILSRRIKNNPALIGEPGVGKTAVVEGLAQRIIAKQVPENLLGKRILQLDLASVVAGASHRGEFEERMKNVVEELKGAKGQIIMFIDEMHTMMGAGNGEGALDASNFIKPALARGEVQFIGATTITEYRQYIEKDGALERRFQPVMVPEPSSESAIKMLKAVRNKYEAFHKVKIPDKIIDLSVKLSKRYIGDRFLPDKAFDLMDEGAAAVRLPLISLPEEIKSLEDRIAEQKQELAEREAKGEKVRARIIRSKIDEVNSKLKEKQDEFAMKKASTTTEVTEEIVKDIIAKRTGIPVSRISLSEGDKLVKLEDIIHKRMINQERPVASVAQAVRRGRAGLKSTNRPIGSFVFLGPTGVGKTELAKTLSEVLFDEEEAVIRFDMTEFMERHEVAKLLGSPPGYVGYEEGGKLTEAVRRKPYSVVLFDEVEKAHPDIFNILLQILDDGRLTDNKGRTISFKNTVVICTSNIGTKMIQDEMLKSGKTEIAEPTMVSTYTFTPRGRELLTIGNKYFERDGGTVNNINTQQNTQTQQPQQLQNGKQDQQPAVKKQSTDTTTQTPGWQDHVLTDYFAGQKVEGKVPVEKTAEEPPQDQKSPEEGEQKTEQPQENADEYNKEAMKVVGFPMMGYDTHAISPKGTEVITAGNIAYMRNATTAKEWKATNLIDYFKDNVVINALPDAPDEQLPTIKLKTHAFSPDEQETVTFKDRYWRRKEGTTDWETGTLKDYFKDQKITGENAQFPTTYWDIHTFSPAGREIIIVGGDIWYHDAKAPEWTKQSLHDYFGADFPLEKEIETKRSMEDETDKKKYDLIRQKVMNELLKFFHPELVNRFDEVIVFEPLKYHHMIEIVKLQLKGLAKLLEEQEMGFSATDAAIKQIVQEGFDPIYGARPLRRAIQRFIENPISELIIGKKVQAGDTIIVDFNGDEFIFNVERIEMKKTDALGAKTGTKGEPVIKHFFCEKCANKFDTEVIPTATPVCSKCASTQLQEIAEEKEMTLDESLSKDAKDTKPEDTLEQPEKKEATNDKETKETKNNVESKGEKDVKKKLEDKLSSFDEKTNGQDRSQSTMNAVVN